MWLLGQAHDGPDHREREGSERPQEFSFVSYLEHIPRMVQDIRAKIW